MWKDRLAGEREEKGSHTVRAEYRSENTALQFALYMYITHIKNVPLISMCNVLLAICSLNL